MANKIKHRRSIAIERRYQTVCFLLFASTTAMSNPRPNLGFRYCTSSLHTDNLSLFW